MGCRYGCGFDGSKFITPGFILRREDEKMTEKMRLSFCYEFGLFFCKFCFAL